MKMKRIAQTYTKKTPQLPALVAYVANRNENELIELIEESGVRPGNSTKANVEKMMHVLGKAQKNGNFEEKLKELYQIHPDKNFLIEMLSEKEESYEGEEQPKKDNFFKSPLFRLILVFLVVIILVFIIFKTSD
ncbi:MAG: hypothetical protein MUC49_02280 [Raineya sp.]|jgi:hypothetical protein|nr:hypothetical protein [Raineya sp.]